MLKSLYIRNFVLISEVDINFDAGMTAITGETGAGKSILLGAISLILGARSDTRYIKEGEKKCIVEASFDIAALPDVRHLLEANDLDIEEDTCLMRRELLASGKSRAFICDSPVTTQLMRKVGERLMDVHSQHSNMLISSSEFQVGMLDVVSDNLETLSSYQEVLAAYKKRYHAWQEKVKEVEQKQKERDYIVFQLSQLNEASLKEGEEEEIEEQLQKAQHAQEIVEALAKLSALDSEEEAFAGASVNEKIKDAARSQSYISRFFPEADNYAQRLESIHIELQDMAREASDALGQLEIDPSEQDRLEIRLDLLKSLFLKHQCQNTGELIALRDKYTEELEQIDGSDHTIKRMEEEAEAAHEKALNLARQLHERRLNAAKELSAPLEEQLKSLGIAGALFRIEVTAHDEHLQETGIDEVQFLFSANNQNALRPIGSIASGGEISRFMLALKTIVASHSTLPTILFDEIDTGVSGQVAERMGLLMQRLGERLQVITITHLPQIAALARQQMRVYKEADEDGVFRTHIERLNDKGRQREIAAMLSGSTLTDEALRNAESLLSSSAKKTKEQKQDKKKN